jgi:cysteinyl-tRNA synthetase
MGFFTTKRDTTPALAPLRFTNTMSGTVEETPLTKGNVKMYNCGPTLYGTQHIGNMRAAVFADLLRRTFEVWGYKVQQVINLTDFGHLVSDADEGDDKMSQGLKREGMSMNLENMALLADKYQAEYFADIDTLCVVRSKITFPRASQYIHEQVALISALVEKGYAYETKHGVYYDVSRFAAYGKLGGINLEGQRTGARVADTGEKHGPFDFVLWKKDKKLGWASPWGLGFPGWHIECTAMIFTLLGKQIDVHTGGIEHIPVHHNNELAQAEAASGKQFVKYWLHNDHITIDGKKISKSLGNTIYVHNIVDKGYSPVALRYWFLTAHYRSPANFTWGAMAGADTALKRLRHAYIEAGTDTSAPDAALVANIFAPFAAHIAEDLNTAKALAYVWDVVKNADISGANKLAFLIAADRVLGLQLADSGPIAKLVFTPASEVPEEVSSLLNSREEARKNKDFARADQLRKDIEAAGYDLTDAADGPKLAPRASQIE